MKKKKALYLDYAATTPVDPALLREYAKITKDSWANPSSPHRAGQRARKVLDEARERASRALGAEFGEIIFTGSATEANNLALRGIVDSAYGKEGDFNSARIPEVIISDIEHASIFETAQALAEQRRIKLLRAPVNSFGRVDPAWIAEHLNPQTILVSVMWVNNEIGTVQEIQKIASLIREFKESKNNLGKNQKRYPLFHTDAVQAFQYFDVNVSKAPIDLLTLAGHKMYAPKGTGLLYVRNGVPITAQIRGGGQERGLRSGTESVPLAYVLSHAMETATTLRSKEFLRLRALQEASEKFIKTQVKNARILSSTTYGSPHIISILIDSVPADELLYLLDEAGIAASLGSACTTGKLEASRILSALGIKGDAYAPLRLSLGRETQISHIKAVTTTLERIGKGRPRR